MTTKVRALTEPEKTELAALLEKMHAHVRGCVVCQVATGVAEMCTVGRDNDQDWQRWLGGHQ